MIIGLDTLQDPDSMYPDQPDIRRDVFLNTGSACNLLVDAFSKLPNLRSVGLRDYDGNGRHRDGDWAKWRSYGWSLGGTHLQERPRQRYASPDSMLPILLFALGKASVKPTNLEAFLRRRRMPDHSFDLSCLQLDVTPVLSGLRTLLLSLNDNPPFPPQQGSISTGHNHLQNFLQHTPLLEHLRLNFTNQPVVSSEVCSEGFLRWFGTPSGVSKHDGSTSVALAHLTALDLGMLCVTPKTLLQVVSKFAKLKSLSLWKVNLQCLEDRGDNAGCLWASCLPEIGKAFQAPEDFSTVLIGYAGEMINFNVTDVKFASNVSVDGNGEKKFEDPEGKVSYRKRVGSNVQDWFGNLGKRAFIEKPEYLDSDDSDDSEGDEDDDGEVDDIDDGEGNEEDNSESDADGGDEAEVIVLD